MTLVILSKTGMGYRRSQPYNENDIIYSQSSESKDQPMQSGLSVDTLNNYFTVFVLFCQLNTTIVSAEVNRIDDFMSDYRGRKCRHHRKVLSRKND